MSADMPTPAATGLIPHERRSAFLREGQAFSEARLHRTLETSTGSHLPKEGREIMLPLFWALSFFSVTSHLLNPACTPAPAPLHCLLPDCPGSGDRNPA